MKKNNPVMRVKDAYVHEWTRMREDFNKPPCPWACRGCKKCACQCRCKEPDKLSGGKVLSEDTRDMDYWPDRQVMVTVT